MTRAGGLGGLASLGGLDIVHRTSHIVRRTYIYINNELT